tara:strand:+ start:1092 stop:1229 length:138 start_codon:yes stop_codon:yes gene_type:complete
MDNLRDRPKLTKTQAKDLLESGDMAKIKAHHKSVGLWSKAIKKKD